MKKYIYKTLAKNLQKNIDYSIDDLNKLGEEGFRVVSFNYDDFGNEILVLEKEYNDFP